MGKPFLASPSSVPNRSGLWQWQCCCRHGCCDGGLGVEAELVLCEARQQVRFTYTWVSYILVPPYSGSRSHLLLCDYKPPSLSISISHTLSVWIFSKKVGPDQYYSTTIMLYVTFDLERESSNEFENWKRFQRPTLLFALATHIYPCHLILFVCSFLWAWAWAWTCGSSSGLVQLIWVQTSDCQFFFFFGRITF